MGAGMKRFLVVKEGLITKKSNNFISARDYAEETEGLMYEVM